MTTLTQLGKHQVDRIELAILTLLYAEETEKYFADTFFSGRQHPFGGEWVQVDIAQWIGNWFKPSIDNPWLFGWGGDEDRLIAGSTDLLTSNVVDLLSPEFTYAFLCDGLDEILRLRHLKMLKKLPRPFYSPVPRTHFFAEYVCVIKENGKSMDQKLIHGWKGDSYIPILVTTMPAYTMPKKNDFLDDKVCMIIAASCAEQARYGWRVTVSSKEKSIRIATDGDGIKALASLRDDPRAGESNRRSPLLHWVQRHTRQKKSGISYSEVKKHLRGIIEFESNDLFVRIDDPQKEGPVCAECGEHEYPLDDGVCVYCWKKICPEY